MQPSLDQRQLRVLVAAPREDLSIELKGWLNFKIELDRSNLAKAIIAIANHGGGHVLIGWTEAEGTWRHDADERPQDLSTYSQDEVNSIVRRYAEPGFHCEVHHVPDDEGLLFPVIVVPGGHRVPIRTKCDDPERKHVKINTYYIRRPGPTSEAPQSAREWDELIRRCILSAREQLLDDFRRILRGESVTAEPMQNSEPAVEHRSEQAQNAPALFGPPGSMAVAVESWHSSAMERWRSLTANNVELRARYQHGIWTVAYVLGGDRKQTTLQELRAMLVKAERHETGWPLWWVPNDDLLAPYPMNGLIECWLRDTNFKDAAHSDFWLASPNGTLFSLRGFQEDGPEMKLTPGTFLDATIPIWRAAEALIHASAMAEQFADARLTVAFKIHWEGLKDRTLGRYRYIHGFQPRRSRQDIVDSTIVVSSDQIASALPELVAAATRPLYEAFEFFSPSAEFIESEIAAFKGRTVR